MGENIDLGDELGELSFQGGGGIENQTNNQSDLEVDIEGMRLAHPNPFQEKMKRRDPTLFLKGKSILAKE